MSKMSELDIEMHNYGIDTNQPFEECLKQLEEVKTTNMQM